MTRGYIVKAWTGKIKDVARDAPGRFSTNYQKPEKVHKRMLIGGGW